MSKYCVILVEMLLAVINGNYFKIFKPLRVSALFSSLPTNPFFISLHPFCLSSLRLLINIHFHFYHRLPVLTERRPTIQCSIFTYCWETESNKSQKKQEGWKRLSDECVNYTVTFREVRVKKRKKFLITLSNITQTVFWRF